MHILFVHDQKLPVFTYGGTERVIWGLAKSLKKLGHQVSFLLPKGSSCNFAKVLVFNPELPLNKQIPEDVDLVHFQKEPNESLSKPYIVTIHGNINEQRPIDSNAVFVSKNHANRYNSNSFVHNGLDWEDYQKPDLTIPRKHFHFLGNAAWRVKNVKGAIDIINKVKGEKLAVLGGKRFNFKMGIRFTLSPKISFYGMVGGAQKCELLNYSKGLIFPVRWHEPFGLAITESLFYGCPIFATPYGAIPELVSNEFGYLSNKEDELTQAIQDAENYSKIKCHEYARDVFNSDEMAKNYVKKYEMVLNQQKLNETPPQLIKIEPKFLDWIQ